MTEKAHVPDGFFISIALLVQVLTYGLLIFIYPELPDRIATHYNLTGQPDAFAVKNIWTVFAPAFLQTAMTGLLATVFRHPQYAHIPGTLFLPLLPDQFRRTIEHVIKHMLVMLMLLLNLIFANVALTSVMVAFHIASGLNTWLMILLVLLTIALPIEYSILMVRLVRGAVQHLMPLKPPTTTPGSPPARDP